VAEVSPSSRPAVAPTIPLVQVEPRFRLVLGLGVRFPAEDEAEPGPVVEPEVARVAVRGIIVGRDGAGVAGATVRVAGAEGETDASGLFELAEVPVGTHQLRVTAPGHVEAVQQITVTEEGAGPEVRVALTPAIGTIRGRILRPDGAPLDGATVRYGEHETMTDGSGRFELRDVPMGQGQITVEALGFVTGTSAVDVAAGGEAEVEVSLERALPAGQIRGQVLSFDGTPVAQARIRVEGSDIELTTGDDGQFQTDVPPGDYTVVIEADQHVGQRRRVTVEEMGVTVINVDLRRRR
jgi:uncharacterized membrane protein